MIVRGIKLETEALYNTLVNEWLHNIGFAKNKGISSNPITINVDNQLDIHCCLTSNQKILLIAEWSILSLTEEVLTKALNENQPISQSIQPRIALRDNKYWQCWIDTPIYGCSLPILDECFIQVIQCVERFLDGIGIESHVDLKNRFHPKHSMFI
jgi:hypothetical protein